MHESGHCRDRTSSSALRLEARQQRLGILANPARVDIPVLPPRDVWTRWPKLRSARRREQQHDQSPDSRLARDPVLNGQKLATFMSELRSRADRLETPVAGDVPAMDWPGTATSLDRMRGRAGRMRALALPAALLVALSVAVGVLAWAYGGGR